MKDEPKIELCPVCGNPPIVSGGKGETVWVKCCAIRLVAERWNPYAVERLTGRQAIAMDKLDSNAETRREKDIAEIHRLFGIRKEGRI